MPIETLPPAAGFGVFVRIWQNGNLMDEQLIRRAATIEEATSVSQRITHQRVRLNNDDVTVSIEPLRDVAEASKSADLLVEAAGAR